MPKQKAESAVISLSSDNQASIQQREFILTRQNVLLDGKSWTQLSEANQILYFRLEHDLANNYLQAYHLAVKEQRYNDAAVHYLNVIEKGHVNPAQIDVDRMVSVAEGSTIPMVKSTIPEMNLFTGIRYKLGLGLPANMQEAKRWFQFAAKQGDDRAPYFLAMAYGFNGEDRELAIESCRLSAEQSYAPAQCEMAIIHPDPGMGRRYWYQLALEQGYSPALCNLGFSYIWGDDGVEKDVHKGCHLIRLSVEQGNIQGTFILSDELYKMNTPKSLYTIALLENKIDEVIRLLLTHEELQEAFFQIDLEYLLVKAQKDNSHQLVTDVLRAAKSLNKNPNDFLLKSLFTLNRLLEGKVLYHQENAIKLESKILATMNFNLTNGNQVRDQLTLLCKNAQHAESTTMVKPIIALCFRAQKLSLSMDDPILNLQIARLLVRHALKNQYTLKYINELDQSMLWKIFSICTKETAPSVAEINAVFDTPSLIHPYEAPHILFPQLKQCIGTLKSSQRVISKLLDIMAATIPDMTDESYPQDDEAWHNLIKKLQTYAQSTLARESKRSIYPLVLMTAEKDLFTLVSSANTKALYQWIEAHKGEVVLANSMLADANNQAEFQVRRLV